MSPERRKPSRPPRASDGPYKEDAQRPAAAPGEVGAGATDEAAQQAASPSTRRPRSDAGKPAKGSAKAAPKPAAKGSSAKASAKGSGGSAPKGVAKGEGKGGAGSSAAGSGAAGRGAASTDAASAAAAKPEGKTTEGVAPRPDSARGGERELAGGRLGAPALADAAPAAAFSDDDGDFSLPPATLTSPKAVVRAAERTGRMAAGDVSPDTGGSSETDPLTHPFVLEPTKTDGSQPIGAEVVEQLNEQAQAYAQPHGAPNTLQPPPLDPSDRGRLLAQAHAQPHSVLGAHPATVSGTPGVVVRAMQPHAARAEVIIPGPSGESLPPVPMVDQGDGIFAAFVPGASAPLRYRLRFHFPDGNVWERDDAYRFLPTVGEMDLHLFGEGTHRRLWEKLGAHLRTIDGVEGVSFAVWAPNAQRVSVVGDFCQWDGRVYPMRSLGASGVWELFIPEIRPNALYQFEMLTREGMLRVKTDPFAFKMQQSPGTASIVQAEGTYQWGDTAWMEQRRARDLTREPMLIYEVHLGSWARVPEEGDRPLTYREIAPRLAEHVTRLGFTHIELLPVMEHPFYGSWGYQVSGYYAPTSRYGSPDDFRYFVDVMHQHGIGVLLDWVPAHFPKDDFALRRFDGTALFEHEDPRLGEHPDWGTLIFNYGRNEVRNFLVANALYWLQEFHCDGLRVDAVASMLYLDYSRKAGEWLRNRHGGRENLDAIDFLRQLNDTVHAEAPGCVMIAEESTAWPGVTRPANEGGLGFTFKWNMGWMHDTLSYYAKDPLYRRHHQDLLTFSMVYEYSERFIMPLSHDEVVHLKGSMLGKMPGDEWQKLANLRALMSYMYTRPGKSLVFMGAELATLAEWNHDRSLDWHLLHDPRRQAFCRFLTTLGQLYRSCSPMWRNDHQWNGFSWIDVADRENSVLSYVRWDGERHVVVVLNLTPVPRDNYRIGAPSNGAYTVLLHSDEERWGGSGYPVPPRIETEPAPFHGYPQSFNLMLPPLSAVILAPEHQAGEYRAAIPPEGTRWDT